MNRGAITAMMEGLLRPKIQVRRMARSSQVCYPVTGFEWPSTYALLDHTQPEIPLAAGLTLL